MMLIFIGRLQAELGLYKGEGISAMSSPSRQPSDKAVLRNNKDRQSLVFDQLLGCRLAAWVQAAD